MIRPRKYISSQEIAQLLSPNGRKTFYRWASMNKVRGTKRNLSQSGHIVERRGFLEWLAEHPECRAEQTETVEAAPEVSVSQ